MLNLNVDIGQILIATLIGIVGWLIGNKLSGIDAQLTKHDNMIMEIWKYLTSVERNRDKG